MLLFFVFSFLLFWSKVVVLQQVQQMRWITSAVIISADLLQCCCSLLQSAAGIHHSSSSAAKAADASNHYTALVMEKCSQRAHKYITIFIQTTHYRRYACIIPSALVARHRTPLTILSSPPTSSCIHLRSDNDYILIVRVQGELTELWRVYGDLTRGRADSTLAGVCSSEAPLDQSRTIKLWNDLLLRMPSSTIFKLPQTLPEIMLTDT